MKKALLPSPFLTPVLLALALISCGPSKKQLLTQLHQLDQEIEQLTQAEEHYASKALSANVQAFVGGLALGYGTVNGDGELAGSGAGAAYQAVGQAENTEQALQQIRARKSALQRERAILSARL